MAIYLGDVPRCRILAENPTGGGEKEIEKDTYNTR
jgi:hypothetical protein